MGRWIKTLKSCQLFPLPSKSADCVFSEQMDLDVSENDTANKTMKVGLEGVKKYAFLILRGKKRQTN